MISNINVLLDWNTVRTVSVPSLIGHTTHASETMDE